MLFYINKINSIFWNLTNINYNKKFCSQSICGIYQNADYEFWIIYVITIELNVIYYLTITFKNI